jgi:uncharacterized repeat protein (TIGR03803 family)
MMGRIKPPSSLLIFHSRLMAVLVLTVLLMPVLGAAQGSPSGTYRVIHDFTGGRDGGLPYAGLISDQRGNLYGTAFLGGRGACPPQNIGCGTVYRLKRSASGWNFQTLYAFQGGNDGAGPYAPVTIGPNGSLYGTTNQGGDPACPSGCGVFEVKPAACATHLCPSTEAVLYRFQGNTDGFYPFSNVIFDKAGNLYGTTEQGGSQGPGTVFELTLSKQGWKEHILYNFPSQGPGNPYSGVIFGRTGDLYGTVSSGGCCGAIYQLSRSDNGWTENTIHKFQGKTDGEIPTAALTLSKSGDLIGATGSGGANGEGTVYSLRRSKNGWAFTTLYTFPNEGTGPWAQLTMDASGNLYGTTQGDAVFGTWGTVFKLTHTSHGWKETVLHRFTGGNDGGIPLSNIVIDAHGNLYGTASVGGTSNVGVVFEITP